MKALKLLLMDRHELGNPKIVTTEMFNEAIAELEEAIKPKTCNECEWWDFNSYGIFKKCFNGKGNCVSTESSFGCNRFKQKDNAC